jgi:hypothetical protein
MGKVSWSIESSVDKDYIFERAKMLGWFDTPQRVQVREWDGSERWWIIEPYEDGCNCPSIIPPSRYRGDKNVR